MSRFPSFLAASKEKERLDKEVAKYQQRANDSKEDIATAGKLKVEAEAHEFTLELMLDLTKEFAGYENVRVELAGALKKCGTLKDYIASLDEQAPSVIAFLEVRKARVTITEEGIYTGHGNLVERYVGIRLTA